MFGITDDFLLLLLLSFAWDFNGNSVLFLTRLCLIFICGVANDAHLRLVNDIKLSFSLNSSRIAFLHSALTNDLELLSCGHRLSSFRHIILSLVPFDFELATKLLPVVISLLGQVNAPVEFVTLSAMMVHVASHSESIFASCAVSAV